MADDGVIIRGADKRIIIRGSGSGGGGGGGTPDPHVSTHESGGIDELDVTNLSGLLADAQTPRAHASTHAEAGSDELDVANLGSSSAAGANLVPLSDGVGGVDWATPPGGAPLAHASTHENGGADELNVADLSGLLADAQTPLAHASSHSDGGADELDVANLGSSSTSTAGHLATADGVGGVSWLPPATGGSTRYAIFPHKLPVSFTPNTLYFEATANNVTSKEAEFHIPKNAVSVDNVWIQGWWNQNGGPNPCVITYKLSWAALGERVDVAITNYATGTTPWVKLGLLRYDFAEYDIYSLFPSGLSAGDIATFQYLTDASNSRFSVSAVVVKYQV